MDFIEKEQEPAEFKGLKLRSTHKEYLPIFKEGNNGLLSLPKEVDLKGQVELLAVSNKLGYTVIGLGNEFLVVRAKNIHTDYRKGLVHNTEFYSKVKLDEGVVINLIRLSPDERKVIVITLCRKALFFDALKLLNKEEASVMIDLPGSGAILDFGLNPDYQSYPFILALSMDGQLLLLDNEGVPKWKKDDVSAVCWSPKGKRMAIGLKTGEILLADNNGIIKKTIPLPPSYAKENFPVLHINWVNPDTLAVVYWDETPKIVMIKDANQYSLLGEMFIEFGSVREDVRVYSTILSGLSNDASNVIFLASNKSIEIVILHKEQSVGWYIGGMDDLYQITLPLSDGQDHFPLGLALDLTPSGEIHNLLAELPKIPATPIFLFLNSRGEIQAYDCISLELSKSNIASQALVHPQDEESLARDVKETPDNLSSAAFNDIDQIPQTLQPDSPEINTDPGQEDKGQNGSFSDSISENLFKHPLFENKDFSSFTFQDITSWANQPPEFPKVDHTRVCVDGLDELIPTLCEPLTPAPLPTITQPAQYAAYRKLASEIHYGATLMSSIMSLRKDDSINTTSKEIEALPKEVTQAQTTTFKTHHQCLEMLSSLQNTEDSLHKLEKNLAMYSHPKYYTETNHAYQVLVTSGLVNLERKLLSFQNLLSVLYSQVFPSDDIRRDEVIARRELSAYLGTLQSLHAENDKLLNKIALIRTYNQQLSDVYSFAPKDTMFKELRRTVDQLAGIPFTPEAFGLAHHSSENEKWLQNFHLEFTKL